MGFSRKDAKKLQITIDHCQLTIDYLICQQSASKLGVFLAKARRRKEVVNY